MGLLIDLFSRNGCLGHCERTRVAIYMDRHGRSKRPRDDMGGGFTLIEVVIAIAVFMVIIVGSLGANNLTSTSIGINKKRSQANILAKEGMEALLSVRAANFPILTSGDFHPVFDVNGWHLDPGSEQKGEFSRTITLSPVMRDLYCTTTICDIIPGGGVIDGNSLNAMVKVTWKEIDQNKEYLLNTLITYWR